MIEVTDEEHSFVATSFIELYDVAMSPYIDVQKTLEPRQRRDVDNKGLPAYGK